MISWPGGATSSPARLVPARMRARSGVHACTLGPEIWSFLRISQFG